MSIMSIMELFKNIVAIAAALTVVAADLSFQCVFDYGRKPLARTADSVAAVGCGCLGMTMPAVASEARRDRAKPQAATRQC